MKIFINDIPVFIIKGKKLEVSRYDHVIDGNKEAILAKQLIDDVLILNASKLKVEELFQLMTLKKFKQLDSVTFVATKKRVLINYIKTRFKVVEAAGGVVEKGQKNLLIFRQGKWDLPKGKLDKGETIENCAVREVQEETGVEVELKEKICHTWHTYTRNKRFILKKTHWYRMACLDDSKMSAQKDEGIEDVRWMSLSEIRAALYDSYRSIRSVMQDYHKMLSLLHGVGKEL